MCGIAGIVKAKVPAIRLQQPIDAMSAAMRHRGPDGKGQYVQDGVALGHVRLAIIDLSEAAAQPLANEDRSLQLVVNGEIYNHQELRRRLEEKGHRFRSRSDSEVVLHLYEEYGDECVKRLDGMFALALWDNARQRLLLARDRFGIKPLYYAPTSDGILFASELSALLASGMMAREIDPLALYGYMTLGYVPTPKSIIKGIRKLGPAECLAHDFAGIKRWRFWYPQRLDVPRSYAQAMDALQERLEKSVAAHLIADVPVASFLSGGVDSSLVVALASRHRRMNTVCASFPGSEIDESQVAAEVANHLGTDHREVPIGLDPASLFTEAVRFLDEPFADSSAMPTYAVCKAGRGVAKVMLSGDGGDEAFGGYTGRYRVAALKATVPAPAAVAKLLRCLPPWRSGRRVSLPAMLDLAALDEVDRYIEERQITTRAQRETLFTTEEVAEGEAWLRGLVREVQEDCPYTHPVHRALWLDISTSLADDMLTKVDRMSMAHGLEVRVPFLDHRLVEFALSCPAGWLVSARAIEGKRLLRSVAAPMLPASILDRPKHGFVVPLDSWLDGPLARALGEEERRGVQGVVDLHAFETQKLAVPAGRSREDRYALLVLAAWLKRLRSNAVSPAPLIW